MSLSRWILVILAALTVLVLIITAPRISSKKVAVISPNVQSSTTIPGDHNPPIDDRLDVQLDRLKSEVLELNAAISLLKDINLKNEHCKPSTNGALKITDLISKVTLKEKPPKLAMVVPFVLKQRELLFKSLRQWGSSSISACNSTAKGDYKEYRKLVFYYDLDLTADPELHNQVKEELLKHSWITDCFEEVAFASAMLTAAESVYVWGNFKGPNRMWLQAFDLEVMSDRDYWILIEPDCVAIRDNWLDRFYEETAFSIDDFWMKGSTNRIPHYGSFHMNGNAIYKLHDGQFKTVILNHVATNPGQPYDTLTIEAYNNLKKSDQALFKEIQHKVVFADFVQDWSSTTETFPFDKIKATCPNTVMVHNKKASMEWIDGKP